MQRLANRPFAAAAQSLQDTGPRGARAPTFGTLGSTFFQIVVVVAAEPLLAADEAWVSVVCVVMDFGYLSTYVPEIGVLFIE